MFEGLFAFYIGVAILSWFGRFILGISGFFEKDEKIQHSLLIATIISIFWPLILFLDV